MIKNSDELRKAVKIAIGYAEKGDVKNTEEILNLIEIYLNQIKDNKNIVMNINDISQQIEKIKNKAYVKAFYNSLEIAKKYANEGDSYFTNKELNNAKIYLSNITDNSINKVIKENEISEIRELGIKNEKKWYEELSKYEEKYNNGVASKDEKIKYINLLQKERKRMGDRGEVKKFVELEDKIVGIFESLFNNEKINL